MTRVGAHLPRWARALAASIALVPALALASPEEEVIEAFKDIEAWQLDEARDTARELLAKYPDNASVLALFGELKFHSSDYSGAVAMFERAEAGGAPAGLLESKPLAKAALGATDGYAEAIGESFIIRYTPGRDAILVPYALETLEAARRTIGDLLGYLPKSRLVLELYPSAATLATVSTLTRQEIETSGTIALCKWNRLMVTSPRSIVFGYAWRDTIAHELAHLILGTVSRNTVPIWMHEGIAKFVETAWRGAPGEALPPEQERALVDAAKNGTLIPFERMHPSMAKLKSQEETSLAFAEVFTFVEFLVAQKGWAGMRSVIKRMSAGASDETAIEETFGVSLRALFDQWMAELPSRKVRGGALAESQKIEIKDRADAPDDSLHGLSADARRFARAADLLFSRGRLVAAKKELEKALEKVTDSQVRSVLGTRLARVALATGDLVRAEEAARKTLELVPEMAAPNVLLAEALVRQGKAAEARGPLDKALAVNPFDPTIHRLIPELPGTSEEVKRRAAAATAILSGRTDARLPLLGSGGLLRVAGAPFMRVLVETSEQEGAALVPVGMTTPTEAFTVRPGPTRLHLVPLSGKAAIQLIEVPRVPPGQPPFDVLGSDGT